MLVTDNESTFRRGLYLVFTIECPSYFCVRHEWGNMDASIP